MRMDLVRFGAFFAEAFLLKMRAQTLARLR